MKLSFYLAVLLLAVLPVACAPAQPTVAYNGIEIYSPQVRLPGGHMDLALAGYMLIKNTNTENDRLLGAACDFAEATLHETKMNGDVMSMNAIAAVEIPAGQLLELRSGSYHLMLINPTRELRVGETVTLTLNFEKAGVVQVPAVVTKP
jgi:periplasmic copper chaperone A